MGVSGLPKLTFIHKWLMIDTFFFPMSETYCKCHHQRPYIRVKKELRQIKMQFLILVRTLFYVFTSVWGINCQVKLTIFENFPLVCRERLSNMEDTSPERPKRDPDVSSFKLTGGSWTRHVAFWNVIFPLPLMSKSEPTDYLQKTQVSHVILFHIDVMKSQLWL